MNGKLNNTFVKELECKDKEYFVWDTELPNFGVKVNRIKKTFVAQGRINGNTKRITIGPFGVFTVDTARKRAMEILVDLHKGIDRKKEERRFNNRKITLKEVFDNFVKTKVKTLRDKTLYNYERSLFGYFSDWLDKPITNINPEMVKNRFLSIEHKGAANHAFKTLRALINFANNREFLNNQVFLFPVNPCEILHTNKMWYYLGRRQSYILDTQFSDFLRATVTDDFDSPHIKTIKNHCRFLLFTGLRHQEAAKLKWQDVDFDNRFIVIQETKNHKPHKLPLGWRMMEFLKTIKENQHPKSNFVFPSNSKEGHLMNCSHSIKKIKELAGFQFCYHDLRRTFASIIEHKKYSEETIKRLLNHTVDRKDVTSGYITFSIEDLRVPIQDVEDYIFSFENKD